MSSIIKSSRVNVIKHIDEKTDAIDDKANKIDEEKTEDPNDEYEKLISIAKAQAEDIVNGAIEEAGSIKESVIKDAKEELEKIKKETYDEAYKEGYELGKSEGTSLGHQEGYEKGYSEGENESIKLIDEANKIKEDSLDEREKVLGSIERDVIELVINITKKILNQKIDENDEAIIDLVLHGLDSLNSRENIRIRVSKDDFEKVDESKDEILSKVSLIENLTVDMDSNLEKGDCVIESSKGNVDVSVSTQIKNVEKEFKDLLDSE